MFRLLKALPLILAIVALSIITASCGSNQAQVRIVNAIPDASAYLDVYVNGTKIAPNLGFPDVYPTPTTPVSYAQVPSGSDTITSYATGTTTTTISNDPSAKLNASDQYTVLLAGFLQNGPQTYVFQDNNTAPNQNTGQNNVEFRIINGSAYTPTGGFDVCIYQTDLTSQSATPQITGLLIGQSSSYLSLTYEPSYTVLAVAHSGNNNCNGTPYVNRSYGQNNAAGGDITTLVIVDNGGNNQGVSATPIVMTDLN